MRNGKRMIFIAVVLSCIAGLGTVGCGPSKADRQRIAEADSIIRADSLAKVEAEAEVARIEKERLDSIEKVRQDSIAKREERRKAGILMTFTMPWKDTYTLYSNGKIKLGKEVKGSWQKAFGVIQVYMNMSINNYYGRGELDGIWEGFVIGDRFYYDFFGTEGAGDMYYNAKAGTITWGVEPKTQKLSQCDSVKVDL